MTHSRQRSIGLLCLAVALAVPSATLARGGGGGGRGGSGDSSMNPFYGDSYRYFNGRNLGEQGTIFPGGSQAPSGIQLVPNFGARNEPSTNASPKVDKGTPPASDLPPPNAIRPVESPKAP